MGCQANKGQIWKYPSVSFWAAASDGWAVSKKKILRKIISHHLLHTDARFVLEAKKSPMYFITHRIFIANYILEQLHSFSWSHFRWPFLQYSDSEQSIVKLLIVLDVACKNSWGSCILLFSDISVRKSTRVFISGGVRVYEAINFLPQIN